jgi:hypothetical protein
MREGLVIGLVGAALVACAVAADAAAVQPSPKRAAAALLATLRREVKRADTNVASSGVVSRNGRLWLAVGDYTFHGLRMGEPRVRIYRWSGTVWRLDGTVTGALGPTQWLFPASLTGSRDPDFAIEGCGAADNNCLSVVSDIGGIWHAIPFDYGDGLTLEVNGLPAGHLVETMVDVCGCAGGPTTFQYERYRNGEFQPAEPPGRNPPLCDPTSLALVVDPHEEQRLQFHAAACADGWAFAIGTGSGFTGTIVGLFERNSTPKQWNLVSLDNGHALPAAPVVYDLPLSLLLRLTKQLGASLAPQVAAAKLIAALQQRYSFEWASENGIVRAHESDG